MVNYVARKNTDPHCNDTVRTLSPRFELKAAGVRALAFHPIQPLLVASLQDGSVLLWDYRVGALVAKLEGHRGPVRGIAIHSTRSLLVTGGDDRSIKVWDIRPEKRCCQFTLLGHSNSVRSVQFHHEMPWILSASDDKTIRIWNSQSQTCLAVLVGHTHQVLSARFHPKEDLVVSASADKTVTVWDISELRKSPLPREGLGEEVEHEYLQIMLTPSRQSQDLSVDKEGSPPRPGPDPQEAARALLEESLPMPIIIGPEDQDEADPNASDQSLDKQNNHETSSSTSNLSAKDPNEDSSRRKSLEKSLESESRWVEERRSPQKLTTRKHVLKGHSGSVHFACFHPSLPLIISASDDRAIKIWRTSRDVREVCTYEAHHGPVSYAMFHPKREAVISCGKDGSIVVWDLIHKRILRKFESRNSPFWTLTMHPHGGLFAAGHDHGIVLFKLERERPAYRVRGDKLIYVRDGCIRIRNLKSESDSALVNISRFKVPYIPPRSVDLHSTEQVAIISTSTDDDDIYD